MAEDKLSKKKTGRALSDEEVVRKVLAGETVLFELLFRRHSQRVYRAARAILREEGEAVDLVQETYLRAYTHLGPGEARGAPDHPHRGFETVTYILEGRLEHRDSQDNAGTLGPGDVQWMTAGAGVVHSEMPEAEFRRKGGRMHGFQLWVNLPRRDKMMKSHYQEIPAARIPVARSADGLVTVKIIAGEAFGARAVIETRTPILYLHYTLQPGARVVQPVPRQYNTFAYVIAGEALFGLDARRAKEKQMVLFSDDGDAVSLAVPANSGVALNILLIAGVPLREPVARYGPFVMNTRAEILQAMEDYQSGRLGRIGI